MYLLEPMFQRKVFIFMSCILMNNKDWFDLMVLDAFLLLLLLSWQRRWMPVGDCGTLENPKTWTSPPTSTWRPTPPRAAGRGEARPPDCPSSARPTPVCKVQFIVHQRRTQYRSVGLLLIVFISPCDNRGIYVRSEKLICARAAAERAAKSSWCWSR